MLIPYNTDAPIYHWPIATGVLIAANFAAYAGLFFVLPGMVDEDRLRAILGEVVLQYGHGLRPWQWVTSNFVHGGILHLVGNMFCLWGLGLVVEGKLGWKRFLAVYFGIGVGQCAVEQTLMLFSSGASLGASAIIYGLLVMCLVWAPRNEMNCVFLLGLYPILFDIPIITLAAIGLVVEVATGLLAGLSMSSHILHLMGAVAGWFVAVTLLKRNWVDCEGWDLLHVWQGRERDAEKTLEEAAQQMVRRALLHQTGAAAPPIDPPRPVPLPAPPPASAPPPALRSPSQPRAIAPAPATPEEALRRQIQTALEKGDARQAWEIYSAFARDPFNGEPPEAELLHIIRDLQQQQRWRELIPAMELYLQCFTSRASVIRLNLARILCEIEHRPEAAAAHLAELEDAKLSESARAQARKLRALVESQPSDPNAG